MYDSEKRRVSCGADVTYSTASGQTLEYDTGYYKYFHKLTYKSTAGTPVFYPTRIGYIGFSDMNGSYLHCGVSTSTANSVCRSSSSSGVYIYGYGGTSTSWNPDSQKSTTIVGTWNVYYRSKYTVSYSLNGGSGQPSSQTVYAGINYNLTSTRPTRTGYTFGGWKYGSTTYSPGQNIGDTSVSGSRTYIAVWTPNTYTVSFTPGVVGGDTNLFNRSTISSSGVSYNSSLDEYTSYATENNPGNRFSYMKVQVYSNGSFDYQLIQTTTIGEISASFNKTSSTTHLRLGFNGDLQDKTFTTDISGLPNGTYTIQLQLFSYSTTYGKFGNVKIELGGSKSAYSPPKYNISYQSQYGTLLDPADRPNYNFLGWYTAESGGTRILPHSIYTTLGDQTLYAHWELKTYSLIIYNQNSATNLTNIKISAPGCSVTNEIIAPNSTTTIYHVYSTASYTLNFTTEDSQYNYYLKVNGLPNSLSNVNTVSYNWTPKAYERIDVFVYQRYSINFDANGGSGSVPETVYKIHGTNASIPSTQPTRSGYTFGGWNTNSSGTGTTYTTLYTANSTTTLYANWVANSYNVNFDTNGGGSVSNKTVTFDSNYGELPTPLRSGCNFLGWSYVGESISDIRMGASTTTQWNYSYMMNDLNPGAVYEIAIDSAKVTQGTATQFTTLVYDFTTNTRLDNETNSFGNNVKYRMTCPVSADSTHDLKIIIYAGIMGATSGNAVEYLGVKVTTDIISSSTIVKTARNHYLYAKWEPENCNTLKYDSNEKYFYFEDGEYPQSYVGDAMNATLIAETSGKNPTYFLKYNSGISKIDETISIYTYNDGNKYAVLTALKTMILKLKNGTYTFTQGKNYFFKVEPIRWRVSDYGVSSTQYPIGWTEYGAYNTNFTVVSDKILWFGAVNSTAKEGDSILDSSLYNNIVYNSQKINEQNVFKHIQQRNVEIDIHEFGTVDNQSKVYTTKTQTITELRLASIEDIKSNLDELYSKSSDMVKFFFGVNDEKMDYWSRDLTYNDGKENVNCNLGNAFAITKAGSVQAQWMDKMKGVRFAATFIDGHRI